MSNARHTEYRKLDHDSMVIVLNIDPAVTILEGTPCYFDKSDGLAKPITADEHVPFYCGIAQNTNPVKYHAPIKKMSFYIGDVIAKMFMAAGEAIAHLTPTYIGSDSMHVTVTAGTKVNVMGQTIMDAEEFKVPRTTFANEEVSILMRSSIFKMAVNMAEVAAQIAALDVRVTALE